uniref:Uncharacterized protein n=2 Tax=Lactuca sativa TaxID=4236 RepID=A0A9R1VZT6_LACSA|nr:hypothetical protein LSAT_V11C400179800 [Lactuca sativa]
MLVNNLYIVFVESHFFCVFSYFELQGLMGLANLSSCKERYEEIQEKSNQKSSESDQILDMKSDSFTVDMEPLSHHSNKDLTHSSRINMDRSLSRKGSQVRAEKKMNSNSLVNDSNGDTIPTPKAALMAGTMPEKLMLVKPNTDHILDPQLHHQITIMTSGNTTTTKAAGAPLKSSLFGKKSSSFKLSSIINPRRILFFFATLSSMGTILLICLTLSMAKYNEDDNSHAANQT